MAMTKRKKTTAIVAGVTALALLLGGTFAWTSISQQAKNETAGVVNVGGRLHDDFNGTNKDVYVENFTDPLNGGQPIYARIKLTEYMEVGSEAGQADNADRKATPVVSGTDINDPDTWTTHVPSTSCAVCATTDTCLIHDHWQWTMGGEGDNKGQTTFMPTFNKDKDSLAADINGTYAGTNADDKIYYDDYVEYTTDNTTGGVGVAEADKEAYDGEIYSVIGTELYDNDTDTEDNGGVRQVENVTHTAKQTATAEVMTMAEWEAAGSLPGNYWVYDTDGWAYWANPIMPGEATGLLLDGIEMTKNPGEKCYYAINVVGQFATVGDWEYFDEDNDSQFDGTDNAKTLLDTVSNNVPKVTVRKVTEGTTFDVGEAVVFEAEITYGPIVPLAEGNFDWYVLDADRKVSEYSAISDNGDGTVTLTIGEDETSEQLTVIARCVESGAVGYNAVTIDLPSVYAIAVYREDNFYYDLIIYRTNETFAVGDTFDGREIVQIDELASDGEKLSKIATSGFSVYNYAKSIRFENRVIAGENLENFITGFSNLETVDFTNLIVSDTKSMKHMIYHIKKLTSITFGDTWDTPNLENMYYMFRYSEGLETVDLSRFNTEKVTNMEGVFAWCSNLSEVILGDGWNTSNVTSMTGMFQDCNKLETLDVSKFDTGSVNNMTQMFFNCSVLEADCSSWNVDNVTSYTKFNSGASGVTAPTWVN